MYSKIGKSVTYFIKSVTFFANMMTNNRNKLLLVYDRQNMLFKKIKNLVLTYSDWATFDQKLMKDAKIAHRVLDSSSKNGRFQPEMSISKLGKSVAWNLEKALHNHEVTGGGNHGWEKSTMQIRVQHYNVQVAFYKEKINKIILVDHKN